MRVCFCKVRERVVCEEEKKRLFFKPTGPVLGDLSCHPTQVIMGCSVTLPSAVYILHPPHTHTSVTHSDVSDLYGHGSRRHLDFFPSQSLKRKHAGCLGLPNEHLVFQSGLLAATLF